MTTNLAVRIDAMFRLDKIWAWAFVIVLWLTVAFVFFAIYPMVDDGALRTAMIISAAVLVIFNTASIAAMVNHYAHDKEYIYGLDIRHLDARQEMLAAAHQPVR